MEAIDIVGCLNKHIEEQRILRGIESKSSLILQKAVNSNPAIKSLKTYEWIIWYVEGGLHERVITVKYSTSAKGTDKWEDAIIRDLEKELTLNIIRWIGSSSYEQVIKGEYNGYTS